MEKGGNFLEDEKIIALLWERSQQAIEALAEQYGSLCRGIAFRVLGDIEDARECENDTWLKVWHSIPPNKPQNLAAFVSKIVRNLALDRFRYENRKKRSCEMDAMYSELIECIPSKEDITELADHTVADIITAFLEQQDKQTRVLFVQRYFYMESINDLGKQYGMKPSTVSTKLNRVRRKLKQHLERQGVYL